MNYCFAVKKDPFKLLQKLMHLENLISSEITQTHKFKWHITSLLQEIQVINICKI